jgi:hypothetical protein
VDEKEKALIEEDVRRDIAERGRHGAATRRYLKVSEQHAIKENEADVVPESGDERGR